MKHGETVDVEGASDGLGPTLGWFGNYVKLMSPGGPDEIYVEVSEIPHLIQLLQEVQSKLSI